MFNKDTFRLIRNTSNRFLSLFMIVLVSSGFMMGLFSNGTILRESMDLYNDKMRLQDIQIYSSYGFCDEDLQVLRTNKDISHVFASKVVDAYGDSSQGTGVYRLEEIDREVNLIELMEGRMPKKADEALILGDALVDASEMIGKRIRVYRHDEEISDYLKNDSYLVVGTCRSPAYTTKIMGSSNCDNQDLSNILFIPKENFVFDYYTTIYLTIKGADARLSYTEGYQNYIDTMMPSIEATKKAQQSYLRDKIYDENMDKLNEGKREFLEKKTEGEEKLLEAKQKLDDANIKLIVGQSLIDTNRATLEKSELELEAAEKILNQNEAQVNEGIAQAEAESGMDFDTLYNEVSAAYTSYLFIKEDDTDTSSYTDTLINDLKTEKQQNLERIDEIEKEEEALDKEAEDYAEQLTALESEKQNLLIRNTVIDRALEEYEATVSENDTKQEMLDAIDERFNGSVEKTYIQLKTLSEARDRLKSAREELEEGKQSIAEGYKELEAAQTELNAGKRKYDKGLEEYEEALMTFNDEIEQVQNDLNKAEEELEALPNASWILLDRDSHYSSYMYKNTISQMSAIGYAMPFLFYLVAALVCMTTMTRLVDEQRSQIGIFLALGFSQGQIIGKYVLYALLAAIGGSIPGIIAGQLVFPTVIYNTWRLMYDLPEIDLYFPANDVVICILAFTVLMSIVTADVVRKSLKEMPSQLLRPKAPKSSKRVLLEKIGFLWKRLPFTSKITARNIFRYKSRFFMTVIGVAGCTGLLVVGFGIKDSISDIVSIQYGEIFAYDYQINLENDHHLKENVAILKDNLSNEEVVPFMTYTTKAYLSDKEDDTLIVEVLDARESRNVLNLRKTDRRTSIELDNSGAIVSQKFAINHDLKEGDYILVESCNGLKREVRIARICEFYFQHYLFLSESYYEETFGENVHDNAIAVKSDDKDSLSRDCKRLQEYISTVDFSGLISQFETMIKALDFIILVIILAAGSLALVVLINLIQVNIAERIREIATLKVLGFNDHEVNSYIFKEVLLLTIIGGLLGLPLGVLEHHFIMNVINMDMMMFGMNIKFLSFTFAFLITIGFTLLVSLFMRRHLNEIEMVESLKSVE